MFTDILEDSQNALKIMRENEKTTKEEIAQWRIKINDLNEKLNKSMENENRLTLELESARTKLEEVKQETKKYIHHFIN